MARYYPVSPLFWTDEKVTHWDDQETLLALYLLTCEHRNLEGLFRLPLAYIQADLEWEAPDTENRLQRLIQDGFVAYDNEARVIFLTKALKYHEPKADKQVQGAVNALQMVPPTVLWDGFVEAARQYAPALYKAIGNPLVTPSETGSVQEAAA
jgi:hypothetical protein